MSAAPKSVRLDRLLANMGYGSRKQVQDLVAARQVVLDGRPATRADTKLAHGPDWPQAIFVDGAPLDPLPGFALMLHKPLGATCSHKEAGTLVYDLLPPRWRLRSPAISTVGRLDKETSGLLLMTDNGDLLHRIISPRAKVAKRYRVSLDRPMVGNESEIFAAGTLLLEGETDPLAPAVLETLSPSQALVTITEGRYHQVRRMFAALGNHVTSLHRDRVGGLDLPGDLAPGTWRVLDVTAIDRIFSGPSPE